MIDIRNLTVKRGRNVCLSNVNFCIEKDRGVVGLIGPNGAGKTTLIDCMLGNLRPVNGSSVHLSFSRIGYATDVPDLPASLTTTEAIEYTAILKRVPRPNTAKLLKKVGLPSEGVEKSKTVAELSRGLRQRLAIACALVGDPELLILDEPTSALDPMGREEVLSLISSEGSRRLVLVSSHLLSDIEAVSSELIILNQGVALFVGYKDKLLAQYSDSLLEVSVTIERAEAALFTQSLNHHGVQYNLCELTAPEREPYHKPTHDPTTDQYTLNFSIDPSDERKLFGLLAAWQSLSSVEIRAASKGLSEVFHQLVRKGSVDA